MTKEELEIRVVELSSSIEALIEHNNYITRKLNEQVSYSEYLAESLNSLICYTEFIAEYNISMTLKEYKEFTNLTVEEKTRIIRESKIDRITG